MPHPQRITFYDALAELALARLGPPIATQQHTTEEIGVNADQSQDGISERHANEDARMTMPLRQFHRLNLNL